MKTQTKIQKLAQVDTKVVPWEEEKWNSKNQYQEK